MKKRGAKFDEANVWADQYRTDDPFENTWANNRIAALKGGDSE